jgi:hypothetical protein
MAEMYFSQSTNLFYPGDIPINNLPSDVVGTTFQRHAELLQAVMAEDKQIISDENGYPISVARTITEIKEKKYAEIDIERDKQIVKGVPFTFPGDISGTVQTRDSVDFRNINGKVTEATVAIILSENITLYFRDQEDRTHAFTPTEMIAMGKAVSARVDSIYSAAWTHKGNIKALTSAEQVSAYDITSGWPS